MTRTFVGIDFGGPSKAGRQRKKIVAIAAKTDDGRRFVVGSGGLNAPLARAKSPGRTAEELRDALVAAQDVDVVAADFPFSLPSDLLACPEFAALVGHSSAFVNWPALSAFLGREIALTPPLHLEAFQPWRRRDRRDRYWSLRKTDREARAQPPLKDKFQVLFNMTLLGIAMLSSLRSSGYRIVPFDASPTAMPPGSRELIEVYPGAAMRSLGCADYKRSPAVALNTILEHCRTNGIFIELADDIRELCETYDTGHGDARDPDASDALIALCVGILYRAGRTKALVAPADIAHIEREGVIWSVA